jgi:hypothetical protein
VRCTGLGATLQGAVDPVPACDAEAGPVLALPVEAAAEVAAAVLTPGARPALGADASGVLASGKKTINEKLLSCVKI